MELYRSWDHYLFKHDEHGWHIFRADGKWGIIEKDRVEYVIRDVNELVKIDEEEMFIRCLMNEP